jgi:hypothetical protein
MAVMMLDFTTREFGDGVAPAHVMSVPIAFYGGTAVVTALGNYQREES